MNQDTEIVINEQDNYKWPKVMPTEDKNIGT